MADQTFSPDDRFALVTEAEERLALEDIGTFRARLILQLLLLTRSKKDLMKMIEQAEEGLSERK